MSTTKIKIHPIDDEKSDIALADSMIMNVFESNASIDQPEKSKNYKVNTISPQNKEILKAIEQWNLKEIMALKGAGNIDEDIVFPYEIPVSVKSIAAPILSDYIENCTFLHYAALHRATRIVKVLIKSFGFNVNIATKSGLTALHISAAIGDFYTVRQLLENEAIRNLTDKKRRTPMHYAVHTNIETCIALSIDDIADLELEDDSNKTCFKYAETANKPYIIEYLEGLCKMNDQFWIPQHIYQLDCNLISPRKEDRDLCECGQNIINHYSIFDKYDVEKEDFIEKPTNYYGELEFSRLYKSAPYIRMSETTTTETITNLLIDHWQVNKPSLIISIYGSDFEGHAIKEILKKAIWKSGGNEGTHIWIITNGIATNLIQVVGEALRNFTDAYGEDQLYALAILPWSFNKKTDFLCSKNYQGNPPTEYQQTVSEDSEEKLLDPNHTHYLFIDIPKSANEKNSYLDYRLNFENSVCNLNEFRSKSDVGAESIPLCGILVSGSTDDLKLLHGSIIINGKPTVVIKGSGGLANLIGDILEDISDNNRKKKTLEEALDKDRLRLMMMDIWDIYDEFEDEIKMFEEVIENRHLIEIFSLEEDLPTELDKKILSCLLTQDKNSSQSIDNLNISQLSIAININRCDVAKEKIFTEGKKWKADDLNPLVSKTITENKVGFVKLFIEKGFNLGKIISPQFLETLYTSDIFNEYKSAHMLNQGLRFTKFRKTNGRVTLFDIGNVIKYLLGELYYPLYLRNNFEENRNSEFPFERPIRELYVWSLLTQRMELAEILWTLELEAIPAALFASNILRSMINLTDSISYREDLSHWAELFEEKAEGVIEECYRENPLNTRANVIRKLEFYGKTTCLELAADGNSIKFISHRSCQELLDSVWRYSLDDTAKSMELILCMVLGVIFPFILPFVVRYKPSFYLPETAETVEKENKKAPKFLNKKENSNQEIVLQGKKLTEFRIQIYFQKIFDFYSTPLVKFSYHIFFYVLFILYFTFLNLTGFHIKYLRNDSWWPYILLIIWTFSLGVEEIRQAFGSGISFKAYISDLWNKIDILGHIFFLVGTVAIILAFTDLIAQSAVLNLLNIQPMTALSDSLFRCSKFAYGFSIFLFTIRMLQYFSINIHMGPIIVMIQSMLANDLPPYMIILMTMLVSYGILLWCVNFRVNYELPLGEMPKILYQMMRTVYFQMYGDLRIDVLRGETILDECTNSEEMCPDIWGVWLGPIIASFYMVISIVLVLNLLIAQFSNTYEIIQSSATQYWTLERYHLMRQSTNRPPVASPLLLFWQIYYIFSKLCSFSIDRKNPFKKDYKDSPAKEKQLIQWEHMRAIDYIRSFDDNSKKKRPQQTFTVSRGQSSAASIGNIKKDLETLKNEMTENFRERLSYVENKLQKLEMVDKNIFTILDILNNLGVTDTSKGYSIVPDRSNGGNSGGLVKEKLWNPDPNSKEMVMARLSNRNRNSRISNIDISQIRKLNKKDGSDSKDASNYYPSSSASLQTKDSVENSTKLRAIKINNHTVVRLVPLLNNNQPLKAELSFESEVALDNELFKKSFFGEESVIPVNPYRNLNKIGKGLLPFWGANKCIHIIISRWKRDEKDNIVKHLGKPVLQVIAIDNKDQDLELPFIFVQHHANCIIESCSFDLLKSIIKDYINRISKDLIEMQVLREKDLSALNTSIINELYRGYIDDFRNTDNSWMETIAYNIQQIYNLEFSNRFLEVLEHHETEKGCWVDVMKSKWRNPSNIKLLSLLSSQHEAWF